MNKDHDAQRYTELFISFCNHIEAWFRKGIFILLAALCLFQIALRSPDIRQWLSSADKYEGIWIHKNK